MKALSRRGFIKTAALASTTLAAGSSMLASCRQPGIKSENLFVHNSVYANNKAGVAGMLYSQIGYESGRSTRIMLRGAHREAFSSQVSCRLTPLQSQSTFNEPFTYWGEIWKSHWWVAEFKTISETGEWHIEAIEDNRILITDMPVKIGNGILLESTLELASVDMLERRQHFTKVGAGWQDAGTLWVESPAQSAMIIALCELLEQKVAAPNPAFIERIHTQICVGCDYLVMLQKKASELGFDPGAMSHDLHGHEKDVLTNDVVKAVQALSMAARLLPPAMEEKKSTYQEVALRSLVWVLEKGKPKGDYGLSRFQRGLPEGMTIPAEEWQTRDLLTLCKACLEQAKNVHTQYEIKAKETAAHIITRQITKEKAENGFWGHFYEYDTTSHSEKSWVHGIVNNEFGSDMGGIYPNYLMPLIEMLKMWPNDPQADTWKKSLKEFTDGYLIPACRMNPFYLVPQGIFGEEGPIWFCGTFHGTNAIYGYTAALALELAKLFNEPILEDIAYGNLLWLAGLNSGLTKASLLGSVVYSVDLPENLALPVSMMYGVGNRWAGTWFATRGVICNGFTTGKQFVYDVEPKKINDAPLSFTDEDWIPHSAAWLTGVIRL